MIDTGALLQQVDLVDVVRRYVPALKAVGGGEWQGLCPFHDERTPSFTVVPGKGFVHCFGCGAHHDAIGFVMRAAGLDFRDACAALGAREHAPAIMRAAARQRGHGGNVPLWVPIYPVPADAPRIEIGREVALWNPKRGRPWRFAPQRADAYRDGHGRLMGYVLRTEIGGQKITPQVTWCIGPDGSARWCLRAFPSPKPLCGLDDLAARPDAPVLVVEGEKCRAAGAGALPVYVVVCWPGGGKGVRWTNWAPLKGREVVLWPDADPQGREAMLGFEHYDGRWQDGVAQYAHAAGAAEIRYVDTAGQPDGWDIADALDEGWTPRQIAAWAATRVHRVQVEEAA